MKYSFAIIALVGLTNAQDACNQHQSNPQNCKTKWSGQEEVYNPFPDRIGSYQDKEWKINQSTITAVPDGPIKNSTLNAQALIQLQDSDVGPLPGFAPFCSSSGWCGRSWGTPKPSEPAPRVGSYDADGQWIIDGSVPSLAEENPRIPEATRASACSVSGLDGGLRCTV